MKAMILEKLAQQPVIGDGGCIKARDIVISWKRKKRAHPLKGPLSDLPLAFSGRAGSQTIYIPACPERFEIY